MHSNFEIFQPVNTGAPRHDVYQHLARLPQSARIDFEEHTLAGNLILRLEPGLGGVNEADEESKITALPYALRFFDHQTDALEFIRCVKLIAGEEARAYNLQVVAAHYYQELRQRNVAEVLKEMALLALALAAVTATQETLQYESTETLDPDYTEAEMTPAARYELWARRTAQVLGESADESSYFENELRALPRLPAKAAGVVYDEFTAYLTAQEAECETLDEIDALYASFEAVAEQYDEDHVVSLHMSDGERVVVVGTLDDDLDEDSLSPEARPLAQQMYELYTHGFPLTDAGPQGDQGGVVLTSYRFDPRTGQREGWPVAVFGLDTWLDYAVDGLYSERVRRTVRHYRTVLRPDQPRRTVTQTVAVPHYAPVTRSGRSGARAEVRHTLQEFTHELPAVELHEYASAIEVCPAAVERAQTRTILETLLGRWQSDCHTRGLHHNALYRALTEKLEAAQDTAIIARLKREAWQHKEQGGLSLKLFTSWLTRAKVRAARLEEKPLREVRFERGQQRAFIVAQPLRQYIATLTGKNIEAFCRQLHALPRQEQNRLRAAVERENPHFYARVRDGLQTELRKSSPARLRYFSWAFYRMNKPEHPFHLLTPIDQAAAWTLLKELAAKRAAIAPSAPQSSPDYYTEPAF